MQRKVIPKEIKEEIIAKARAGQKVADLAKQYGISDRSIYAWLHQDTNEEVVSILKYNKLKRENTELKRLIGEITLDMSLQKKAQLVRHAILKTVVALALGVNRKNVYRLPKRGQLDEQLRAKIESVWLKHPAYGHRCLGWHLKVNHKRTSRVMRKYGLKPPRRKVRRYCTVSTAHHTHTNLIKDWFPIQPHELWVADISYIKFQGRFWYLSTIVDVVTRQVLAVQVSRFHNHQLILSTLKQAMIMAGTLPHIFHSDQGTEYMAQVVIDFLSSNQVRVSMSDKGSPWQNGYQESFFGRFKTEMDDLNRFETVGELLETIYQHIHYYNYDRIHTALRMPPVISADTFS